MVGVLLLSKKRSAPVTHILLSKMPSSVQLLYKATFWKFENNHLRSIVIRTRTPYPSRAKRHVESPLTEHKFTQWKSGIFYKILHTRYKDSCKFCLTWYKGVIENYMKDHMNERLEHKFVSNDSSILNTDQTVPWQRWGWYHVLHHSDETLPCCGTGQEGIVFCIQGSDTQTEHHNQLSFPASLCTYPPKFCRRIPWPKMCTIETKQQS